MNKLVRWLRYWASDSCSSRRRSRALRRIREVLNDRDGISAQTVLRRVERIVNESLPLDMWHKIEGIIMAYDSKGLNILTYTHANNFTLWHYTTADTTDEVHKLGYFNNAADTLRVGDMLLVNTDPNHTKSAAMLVVAAIWPGNIVEVASMAGFNGSALPRGVVPIGVLQ